MVTQPKPYDCHFHTYPIFQQLGLYIRSAYVVTIVLQTEFRMVEVKTSPSIVQLKKHC